MSLRQKIYSIKSEPLEYEFDHLFSQRLEVNEEGKKAMLVELAGLKKKLDNVEEGFVWNTLQSKKRRISNLKNKFAVCRNPLYDGACRAV